ncbi:CAP domain-containing protein [Bacillus benzoevorans]|uniref:Putative YkwD family protein n=1 Tax=Bacillus benzoevorans TaxID=1456 RepID=A0A7X0HTH0_9BACI|nr:CAP domain-containing protein [Bacillus benzoevorans]MBB6445296.1 putative YkwD family protein [Bacillus benzoevorans]
MKKKFVFSVLATASLLFVSAGANSAEAASYYTTTKKVYVYQTSNQNISKYYQYLQKYNQNCQIQWNNTNNWTVVQKPNETPVQQEPVQKPAETPVQKPASQPQAPVNKQSETPAVSQLSAFEQQVVDLTNQERAKNGLPALKVDNGLSKAARAKSVDMQTKNYFSHTSPTYGSPFEMMKQFGVSYRGAGENIAKGQRSPQEVVNSWMNSPGHRANILNNSFTHIGVGHAANGNYWTQMFIAK